MKFDYLSALEQCRSLPAIEQVTRRFATAYDLTWFAYVARDRAAPDEAPAFTQLHNYPDDWARLRIDAYRSAKNDPVLDHVKEGLPAVTWSARGEVIGAQTHVPRAKRILESAGEAGLRAGMTLPVYSPTKSWALFTFATPNTDCARELVTVLPHAAYFASLAHHVAERVARPLRIGTVALGQRELDVLRWVEERKTASEIAERLNVTKRTVYWYIERAARKLGVRQRQAAPAAPALGLL